MIYVPDLENYQCFVVQSESTIRAYKQVPTVDSEIEYRDYYIRSDYMYRDGSQTFSRYTQLPVCLATTELTNEVYYRVDFDKILVIFLILCIFCFVLPFINCVEAFVAFSTSEQENFSRLESSF